MKKLRQLFFTASALCYGISLNAQCSNNNTFTPGNMTPPGVGLSTSQTMAAGQYMLARLINGAQYVVTTCGNSTFDTQITVHDDATGAVLGYNDDFCGAQSSVTFTATNCHLVRISLDQYSCNPSGLPHR